MTPARFPWVKVPLAGTTGARRESHWFPRRPGENGAIPAPCLEGHLKGFFRGGLSTQAPRLVWTRWTRAADPAGAGLVLRRTTLHGRRATISPQPPPPDPIGRRLRLRTLDDHLLLHMSDCLAHSAEQRWNRLVHTVEASSRWRFTVPDAGHGMRGNSPSKIRPTQTPGQSLTKTALNFLRRGYRH